MMMIPRKAESRGQANYGWLKSNHTFSFANYYDPNYLGFRSLRVINEDLVSPGAGFDTHGHRDMEIVTYVLEGALEHKDSIGNGSIIRPGELQRMSAGTGIFHSEFNYSHTEPVHFLQIWILPNQKGLTPSYEQKKFNLKESPGQLHLLASNTGEDGSLTVHQDIKIHGAILNLDIPEAISHTLAPNRHAWIQVAKGEIKVNEVTLATGDGLAISEITDLAIQSQSENAEFLLFDLV
jgi:redox-sensitive bicupin YhaK (pirin superfamily)